jgi:uncharacterized protein YcfL
VKERKRTMMQKIKKLFCVLFVCSLMAGCAGFGPGKVPFNDPRVTVVGPLIRSEIKATGLTTRINSGNFMEVQVTGVNKASGYRNLEYKIDWIDRDGFAIKTILSRWTMFPAYASSTFSFAGVAPKTSASDFRITIRKKEK